jgi:hypothetical protein
MKKKEVNDKTAIKDLNDVSLLDVFGDEIAHYSLKKKDSVNNKGFFMSSIIVPHEVLLLNIYRCFDAMKIPFRAKHIKTVCSSGIW